MSNATTGSASGTGHGARTLYGAPGSGSAAVEMALRAAGIDYRVVRAATWEPGPGLEELRRVNPLGQIPTLVLPDGTVVSESAAILIHLGLAYPESGLLPGDVAARARALRGLVFVAANCYAAIGVIDYPERWTLPADDAAVNERVRAGARARLHGYWTPFADLFAREPYLGGETPDALDLFAATVSKWAGARAHLAEHRPAFHATLVRVEAHPVVAPAFARHWP